MTSCLRKVVAPCVQAVLPQQKGVRCWKSLERFLHLTSKPLHILVVFQNRQPLGVLVRSHAFEALEHLVAGDGQTPLPRMHIRQDRAPDRMCMQNRPGVTDARHGDVEERLG